MNLPDHIDALLGHAVAEDALDAAVVAEVALGIVDRVVVNLYELRVALVAALWANEKLAPRLSARPVGSSYLSNYYWD